MKTNKTALTCMAMTLVAAGMTTITSYAQRPGNAGQGGSETMNGRPNPSPVRRLISSFKRCDLDRDGVLTAAEVPEAAWERVSAADANKDGHVTSREAANLLASRMLGVFGEEIPEEVWTRISVADANGDGTVTEAELAGLIEAQIKAVSDENGRPNANALFGRFDADDDGALAKEEVPKPMWNRLAAADKDGDGLVSFSEYEQTRR